MTDGNERKFFRRKAEYLRLLRTYFIAGLIVLIPIYVTFGVTKWIYSKINDPIINLLDRFGLSTDGGIGIPAFGFFIAIVLILTLGLLGRNYMGRKFIGFFENILIHIPLVNRIYNGVKQVSSAFLERNKNLFQAVVLVEYPRKGIWTMGFLTETESGEISEKLEREMACVFISTTPNPTSGFLIILPRKDLIFLDMTIEEGLKMVISGGMVTPTPKLVDDSEVPTPVDEMADHTRKLRRKTEKTTPTEEKSSSRETTAP